MRLSFDSRSVQDVGSAFLLFSFLADQEKKMAQQCFPQSKKLPDIKIKGSCRMDR